MKLTNITQAYDLKGRSGIYDVSLDIKPGNFIAFMGPNGAGKSTLLKLIKGEISPQSGEIKKPFKNPVFFPATHSVKPDAIVQNFLVESIQASLENEKKINLVRDWAMTFEFTAHLKKQFSELSQGNQIRVELAAALINYPDCLILDEPLHHLDPLMRENFIIELKEICKSKEITILLATHEKNIAFAHADQLVMMQFGQIEQVGNPIELKLQPKNIFIAQMMDHQNLITAKLVKDSLYQFPWGEMHLKNAPKKEFVLVSIPIEAMTIGPAGDFEFEPKNVYFRGHFYEVLFNVGETELKTWMNIQEFKSLKSNNKAHLSFRPEHFIYLDCLS